MMSANNSHPTMQHEERNYSDLSQIRVLTMGGTLSGEIRYQDHTIPFSVAGNERLAYTGTGFVSVENPGVVLPCFEPPE